MTRRTPIIALFPCLAMALLTAAGVARAATLAVPSGFPTIQSGIDAASFGDTVLVSPGTYNDFETRILPPGASWTSSAFLKDGVFVKSEAGSDVTILDVRGLVGPQCIGVIARNLPSTETSLEGFTLLGPETLGAYVFFCGNVTFRDCVFRDFDGGPTTGGAVIVNGNVTIEDSEFENCVAFAGGGLYAAGGDIYVRRTEFRDCYNGAYITGAGSFTTFSIVEDCLFIDCHVNGGTGGLKIEGSRGVTVRGCTFVSNSTGSNNAAGITTSGPALVENCVFIGNRNTGGFGGAATIGSPSGTVRGCTFVENFAAGQGGAVGAAGSYLYLEKNIFVGNESDYNVVSVGSGVLKSSSCNVFWDNPAPIGYALWPTDREVDPLFCDRSVYDLTLTVGSPCLPEDPLGCGLIGALGQGCGTVSIAPQSWGRIKSYYRLEAR